MIGGGSVALLRLITLAYLSQNDSVLLLEPIFGEYEIASRLSGAQIIRERLLFIEGVEVGSGYASDVKLGLDVLEDARGPGPLLGDAGFDSLAMISKAGVRGFEPIIKLKGGEIKHKLRGEMKRAFDAALYRLRSIAEGVFGGIKTKMSGPLRCLDGDAARKEALLEALSYDIRVYLSLFLFPLDPIFVTEDSIIESKIGLPEEG